jgi:cytochrome c oxidase assembly protein subunit 15
MIASMVWIGGLTRLTESGLSITEWKPVTGTLPPLSIEEWQHEFDLYRQSPEYKHKNYGMTLDKFKGIFWLEYLHRLLGRITGLVFFIPFVGFVLTKRLERTLILKLF